MFSPNQKNTIPESNFFIFLFWYQFEKMMTRILFHKGGSTYYVIQNGHIFKKNNIQITGSTFCLCRFVGQKWIIIKQIRGRSPRPPPPLYDIICRPPLIKKHITRNLAVSFMEEYFLGGAYILKKYIILWYYYLNVLQATKSSKNMDLIFDKL